MSYRLRAASLSDINALQALIRQSAYGLSRDHYTNQQVEAALQGVFGVDTQLIKDQTYYIIEHEGSIAACGGWSYRATLFGNDDLVDRDSRTLDPKFEAAKIRAFFVHPTHARKGLGRMLLDYCEECAKAYGFSKLELGSTLPGRRFYETHGYQALEPVNYDMGQGLLLQVIPMHKTI